MFVNMLRVDKLSVMVVLPGVPTTEITGCSRNNCGRHGI